MEPIVEETKISEKKVKVDFGKATDILGKPFKCSVPPNKKTDKVQWRNCWAKRAMVGIYFGLVAVLIFVVILIIITYLDTSISYEFSGNLIVVFIPLLISVIVMFFGTLIAGINEKYAILGITINAILLVVAFISIFLIFQNA